MIGGITGMIPLFYTVAALAAAALAAVLADTLEMLIW